MTIRKVPVQPFVLTLGVIVADQMAKLAIVRTIPMYSLGGSVMNDFIRILHVRNLGMAFSIGNSFPEGIRRLLFVVLPVIVMIVVIVYYVLHDELTIGMRWALAGILGGGIGNLIDRIFRPFGVIDFISVKVYGFLGFDRWPVFNVADSSVVVSGIVLIVLFVLYEGRLKKAARDVESRNEESRNNDSGNDVAVYDEEE